MITCFLLLHTKKNEEEHTLADIFDLQRNEYLFSAYFERVPNIIKNKKAYIRDYGSEEEFPKIEVYKIDPKVYGK